MFSFIIDCKSCDSDITFVLSYRKTYRIKIHILDYKFFSKLFRKKSCQFHVDSDIFIAFCILKRLKRCICGNYKLIFRLVKFCGFYCCRLSAAEILVTDLIQRSVFFYFFYKCVYLFNKFRLIFINTERILFICKINVDHFRRFRAASFIFFFTVFFASATCCQSGNKRRT